MVVIPLAAARRADDKDDHETFTFVSSTDGKLTISALVTSSHDALVPEIEADLKAGLSDPLPSRVVSNLQLLAGLQKLASTDQIKSKTTSDDPVVQGTALLALLKVGDYSKLPETISFLGSPLSESDQTLLQYPMRNEFERISDLKMLPVLHSNLVSPAPFVRGAVLKAIKKIHDPKSVPYVIKLLDDPDPEIRYDTVITLALIEQRGEWGPASYVYEKEEKKYIQEWKNWWETEGQNRYLRQTAVHGRK
jgi:HEAT repeat protein